MQGAPHPPSLLMGDAWTKPYSREYAAFPASWLRTSKFWPSTGIHKLLGFNFSAWFVSTLYLSYWTEFWGGFRTCWQRVWWSQPDLHLTASEPGCRGSSSSHCLVSCSPLLPARLNDIISFSVSPLQFHCTYVTNIHICHFQFPYMLKITMQYNILLLIATSTL